jgi:hypothetical protein
MSHTSVSLTRLRIAGICGLGVVTLASGCAIFAGTGGQCQTPSSLGEEISKEFPGTHIVTTADLEEYDRKLFRKDHGTRCPGLVKVNFFGDGKPTWALVLISGDNPKRKAQLVVAHLLDAGWEIRSLETTDGTPVVWRQGPGKYEGLYVGEKVIRATRPVIVLCDYGSSAILYAWTGKEVEKVWLSD